MHVATIVVGDVVVGARSGVIIVEEMVELLTMTTREIPTKDPVMLVVVMDERSMLLHIKIFMLKHFIVENQNTYSYEKSYHIKVKRHGD